MYINLRGKIASQYFSVLEPRNTAIDFSQGVRLIEERQLMNRHQKLNRWRQIQHQSRHYREKKKLIPVQSESSIKFSPLKIREDSIFNDYQKSHSIYSNIQTKQTTKQAPKTRTLDCFRPQQTLKCNTKWNLVLNERQKNILQCGKRLKVCRNIRKRHMVSSIKNKYQTKTEWLNKRFFVTNSLLKSPQTTSDIRRIY